MKTFFEEWLEQVEPNRMHHHYTEHFHEENGCYGNICITCDTIFYGRKRTQECKSCAQHQPTPKPNLIPGSEF